MAVTVAVESSDLVVRITGWDAVWALSTGFRVPLAQVRGVAVRSRKEAARRMGLRTAGTMLPLAVVAGRYWWRGTWQFWAVRWPDRVLVVECTDEAKYDRVVLQTTDVGADAARIDAALPR